MGEEGVVPEDEGVSPGRPGEDVLALGVRPHDPAEVGLLPRVAEAVHEGVGQEGEADRRAVLDDSLAPGGRRHVGGEGRGRRGGGQRQDEGVEGQDCSRHRRKSGRRSWKKIMNVLLAFLSTELL